MARARSKSAQRPPRRKAPASQVAAVQRPLKIGEAARLLGVESYVLRFWETQFAFLRPRHSASKHRFYDAKDIETLRLIKRLLHGEGYTIAGAKKHIRETGLERLRGVTAPEQPARAATSSAPRGEAQRPALTGTTQRELTQIREDLRSLCKLLEH